MKRAGMTFVAAVVMFLACHMMAGAEELKLYRLEEKTEIKEQMRTDSETVVTLEAGTPVLYLEESQGWMKIRYQDYEGYVSSETGIVSAASAQEMEEEFKAVEEEFESVYQGILLEERKGRQELLWKIIILVLAVVIIGTYAAWGIKRQVEKRKQKEHKEEKE